MNATVLSSQTFMKYLSFSRPLENERYLILIVSLGLLLQFLFLIHPTSKFEGPENEIFSSRSFLFLRDFKLKWH